MGCVHPRKLESWLRGTRSGGANTASSQRNAGRDSKPGEFTPGMSCIPLGSSSLSPCDGNRCSRVGKIYSSAVLCLSAPERSSLREQSLPLLTEQHLQPPGLSRKQEELLIPLGMQGMLPGGMQGMAPLPICHISRHQSNTTKNQHLEPGHLDNFIIRPNVVHSQEPRDA